MTEKKMYELPARRLFVPIFQSFLWSDKSQFFVMFLILYIYQINIQNPIIIKQTKLLTSKLINKPNRSLTKRD